MSDRGRKRRILFTVLTVLWMLVIWGHSMMPASLSKQESGGLLALLIGYFPWLTDHIIRKAAHFTEYAILGVLLFGAVKGSKRSSAFPPLVGILTAMADETIQIYSEGRSGQVTDVWLDFAGFLLLWGLLTLIAKAKNR